TKSGAPKSRSRSVNSALTSSWLAALQVCADADSSRHSPASLSVLRAASAIAAPRARSFRATAALSPAPAPTIRALRGPSWSAKCALLGFCNRHRRRIVPRCKPPHNQENDMTVRIEKDGPVWTVIHSRPEARNAMDPDSADALTEAFLEFDRDPAASVAVFWGEGGAFCAGWDLKYASTLEGEHPLAELDIPRDRVNGSNGGDIPRGPLGPSRLELDKPVIGAIAGPAVAGGMEL